MFSLNFIRLFYLKLITGGGMIQNMETVWWTQGATIFQCSYHWLNDFSQNCCCFLKILDLPATIKTLIKRRFCVILTELYPMMVVESSQINEWQKCMLINYLLRNSLFRNSFVFHPDIMFLANRFFRSFLLSKALL